ncbi:MAG: hypothetical protein GY810_15325 [Aureispira sp.]|nr:hypothetical protein [Aureispira sp.]
MKGVKILSLLAAIQFFSSCQKDTFKNIVVVHHCTGSYLKIEGKNHLICNKEVVNNYKDGAIVTAEVDYITWEDCDNTWAACMMEFPYEGVIQVKTINQK